MVVLISLAFKKPTAGVASPSGRFWLLERPNHVGESEREGGVEGSREQLYTESEKTGLECGAGKRNQKEQIVFVLNSQSDLGVDECAEKESEDAFKNECC